MLTGLIPALAQALINTMCGRTLPGRAGSPKSDRRFHFVLSHPDDELAVLPTLRRAARRNGLQLTFTLVTDGSQGYEPRQGQPPDAREKFGRRRVNELRESLQRLGISAPPIQPLVDERTLYEALITPGAENRLHRRFDRIVDHLIGVITAQRPAAVFVNDFSGGHVVHDISNALACMAVAAAPRPQPAPVEYWQPYLQVPAAATREQIRADIRRYLRDGRTPHGAVQVIGELSPRPAEIAGRDRPVDFPQLGIRNGRAHYGIGELLAINRQRRSVYGSQEKSLNRLRDLSRISRDIARPRFRRIPLERIDHTRRPSVILLYEVADIWRKRGLKRGPDFQDFARALKTYPRYRHFLQTRTG